MSSGIADHERSSVEQVVGFRVPAALIFEALTSEKQMSAYTQTPCQLEAKVGGKISMFGGSVTGTYEKLDPHELVFSWRFKEWASEDLSRVQIKLEAVEEDATKVILTHTNIPPMDAYGHAGQAQKVEQGWQRFFWERIQRVLGYPKLENV